MPTYRPFTRVADLPANSQGDRTILEEHLDRNHDTLTDVLERIGQALFTAGGVVEAGIVTNPTDAVVRVQGRLGISKDARTFLAVGDQAVDLAQVETGTKCLIVIRAQAGEFASSAFTDATTGEPINHPLMTAWGRVGVLEGDDSDYPALPDDCVPVAEVTKTGASTLTINEEITTAPALRYSGSGGGDSYYDAQMGFLGVPDAGATDTIVAARAFTIDDADPGEVHVGTNPSDGTATIDVQVNGSSIGDFDISVGGAITWSLSADIELDAGDRIALIAPSPADSTLADVLVAFKGLAA